MKRPWKRRRVGFGTPSMEVAGTLSIASQMAMHCPPGFESAVRRELAGRRAAAPKLGHLATDLRR